jgi:3-hydroxybutyrate dehydrogenase
MATKGIFMLSSKTALVTGSTSGIGLAIAQTFAKNGANVVINGFGDAEAIEKERAGIEKEHGVKCVYSGADMTKPDEIAAMMAQAADTFGAVDILVNNAGIQHVSRSTSSRSRNGTRSSRSTSPPPSTRSAPPCRA